MAIYIVLLRGINVGGHNMIKMAELKRMFEAMGFNRVQTYIQSGNVLFESEEEAAQLRQRIEHEIQTVIGLSITVVLRSAQEMEQIIENCPFAVDKLSEEESIYVSLLVKAPSQEGIEKLRVSGNENDEYHIAGEDVYLLFRQSVRNAKLAVNLQKLGVQATMRNWNTMTKLNAMAKAMRD